MATLPVETDVRRRLRRLAEQTLSGTKPTTTPSTRGFGSTPFADQLAAGGQLPPVQTEGQRGFVSRLGEGFKTAVETTGAFGIQRQVEAKRRVGEAVLKPIFAVTEPPTSLFRGAFPIAERHVTVPSATRWPTDPEGRRAFEEAAKRGEIPPEGQEFRDAQREAIQPLLRGEASLTDTAKRLLELGRATSGPEAWGADFFNPAFWVSTYAVPLRLARPLAAEAARLAPGVLKAATKTTAEALVRTPVRPLQEAGFKLATGKRVPAGAAQEDLGTLAGLNKAIKRMEASVKSLEEAGAAPSTLRTVLDDVQGLRELRESQIQNALSPEDYARYKQLQQQLDEATMKTGYEGGFAENRAPSFGSPERVAWDETRARMRAEGIPLPTQRSRAVQQRTLINRITGEMQGLEAQVDAPLAPAPAREAGTQQVRAATQAGMGIGERPPQGQLLPEFRAEPVSGPPLVDAERIAAQQARAAEIARGQAELPVAPPAPAAPAAATGAPPPVKPPVTTGAPPPANPIVPRPRTLADMNREAKGMRALTPEQRAAVMDLAEPITGDVLYKARPFNEHAQNLLGPDTGFMKALRATPGAKQVFRVWNPAQMTRDNPVAMIGLRQSIFQEVEKARIRFATLRWWQDADPAFGFKQTETLRGLKPTTGIWRAQKVQAAPGVAKGKMFGTINDMIEHPERYVLTPEQQRVLDIADSTLTQSVRDAQRAGVNVVELAEAYWPRAITKGPKGAKGGIGGIRKRVGSSKGYTHQRVLADIDDLVALGFELETDPRRVFASRLEAGVDTIAHQNARKQIMALPGVEKPLERMAGRFPEVLQSAADARVARDAAKQVVVKAGPKATPAEVLSMRQAEADYITAMREVFAKKLEAGQPGYYELRLPNGRIAPQELVEEVGKFIDLPELQRQGLGAAAEVTQQMSQLVRTTLTNVDLAAGFIQGQALFYRNNPAWWKANAHSIMALVDDPTAWVAKNWDILDEGVRTGAIVAPTEFLFAKQGLASIPLRIPYAGPALGGFNRAFEWFITVGQAELYKAAKSGAFKGAGMNELVSLGSAIRKEVGTESYALLGVRNNQRTLEALTLFAARFFRANVGLLGQSFTRGPGGAEARKAVGALIAGGTSLLIGIEWATNKKLPNMTDPYAPDWMQTRQGDTYFSTFGPFYPYFRTAARVSVSLGEGDPMKAATAIKRFLSSKESLPLRAIDIAGQLIYYGSAYVYGTKIEREWLSIVKGILSEFVTPISAQEIPSGIAEGRPESVTEFIGLTGRPVPLAPTPKRRAPVPGRRPVPNGGSSAIDRLRQLAESGAK